MRSHFIYIFSYYLSLSLCFFRQGVIQNFTSIYCCYNLEGAKQIIPQGPVASQEAIKMLGINGGGFFNANSAHPFENPTPLSNFIEMLSIFLFFRWTHLHVWQNGEGYPAGLGTFGCYVCFISYWRD